MRTDTTARMESPGRAADLRRRLDSMGIGAFGVLSSIIIIAMFWGLYAIDGLLAQAAAEQREAAADYLQAITQRTADETKSSADGGRDSLAASLSRALNVIRDRPTAVAITIEGRDTIFIPENARNLLGLG